MKRYRVHAHSPDIRTFNLPFADVVVADDADEISIIAAAKIDIEHLTRPLVERLGFVPRVSYAIQELPVGERRNAQVRVLKRGKAVA